MNIKSATKKKKTTKKKTVKKANKSNKKNKNNRVELKTKTPKINNLNLFEKYAKNKSDIGLRNKLALLNQPLVNFIIGKYYSSNQINPEIKREIEQEGNIGLLSAIDGFDHTRGYQFSTYACVPITTQILTRNGWKFFTEVTEGDETLGYKNGYTEWTKINKIAVYENAPLVRFGDYKWDTFCTPEHKWLISQNGETKLLPLTEWTQNNFNRDEDDEEFESHLITSVPFRGGELNSHIKEISILAWILASNNKQSLEEIFSQEKAIIRADIKFKEEILYLINYLKIEYSEIDCSDLFYLEIRNFQKSFGDFPNISLEELILQFSPEVRKIWLQIWKKQQDPNSFLGNSFIIYNKEQSSAMGLCLFLNGFQKIRQSEITSSGTDCYGRKSKETYDVIYWSEHNHNLSESTATLQGTGKVWCPNTDLGSWTARDIYGSVFLTGNTWWIRQAVNNYLINVNPIIRVPSHVRTAQNKLLKKLKISNKGLADLGSINPEDVDLSEKMLKSISSALRSKQIISLNSPYSNSADNSSAILENTLENSESSCEQEPDKEILIETVKKALKSMPTKRKLILLLRYDVIHKEDILKNRAFKAKAKNNKNSRKKYEKNNKK